MWTCVHRPCRPSRPCLRQPGLQLAFGLHLLLQRAQRVEARAEVGLLAPLRALTCLLLRAAARRRAPAPRRCSSCSRASASACASRPGRSALAARASRALSGALSALALGGQPLAPVAQLARTARRRCGSRRPAPGSAAAPARPRSRCSLLRACAARSASSSAGSCCACSSACAASTLGLLVGGGDLRGELLELGGARRRCAAATARSAPSARPAAARRAGGLRRRSGCAPRAGSPRAPPRPARPARACSSSPAA